MYYLDLHLHLCGRQRTSIARDPISSTTRLDLRLRHRRTSAIAISHLHRGSAPLLQHTPTAMRIRIPAWLAAMPREWRHPKTLTAFFIIELPFTVAALALFGIAAPDLYRTLMWQEGANHGWNSDPIEILYAYANYRPVHTPLPWSAL